MDWQKGVQFIEGFVAREPQMEQLITFTSETFTAILNSEIHIQSVAAKVPVYCKTIPTQLDCFN
ncbi:hypothetical protein RvY_04329 [Ramazzottius varieornatus]|uniref:Uncharacterized protein n=1 Tax=Ramazzottius varieornatus TaxID=947166 RepID=A0A1D1UY44_RAMVA|nr:hypothetical protein RvY_04329 [Ramazzottius varieornatus]